MIVGDINRQRQLVGNAYDPVTTISPDHAHVYYNVTITQANADVPAPPTPSTPVPARFREERVQPIVQKMEDYYFSIVRFSIPTQNLPIFLFNPQFTPPNSDPNFSQEFSVSLSYNGTTVRQYVNFIPSTSIPAPLPPFNSQTTIMNQQYYTVNSYEQWLGAINLAFDIAYNNPAFATSPAFLAGQPAPYLYYDPVTQLISLVVGNLFVGTATNVGIGVYMNSDLYDFFNGSFKAIFNGYDLPNGTDYQILVNQVGQPGDLVDNLIPPMLFANAWSATVNYSIGSIVFSGGNFYVSIASPNLNHVPPNAGFWLLSGAPFVVPAEWSASTAYAPGALVLFMGRIWQDVTANTGTPPGSATAGGVYPWEIAPAFVSYRTTQEYSTLFAWNIFKQIAFVTGILPTQYEFTPNIDEAGAMQFKAILTDFEPNESEGPEARSVLQYFPQGPYRQIQLVGKGPISKTDFQVYWVDNMQNFYPVLIGPGDALTIKCLFRKKSVFADG